MWMSSLPSTSRIGFHPLIIVDVKSTKNIDKLTTDRTRDVLLSRITGQSESLFYTPHTRNYFGLLPQGYCERKTAKS